MTYVNTIINLNNTTKILKLYANNQHPDVIYIFQVSQLLLIGLESGVIEKHGGKESGL
jgi:hypothetical protein